MARGDQLARQWKIIQKLLVSRMGKSVADLAAELDCHPRSVYRDLEALQAAGFPLTSQRRKGASLWGLLDTVKQHVPLPLSIAELSALYFSRDLLKAHRHRVFDEALTSLFAKIEAILPPRMLPLLDRMRTTFTIGATPYKPPSTIKAVIEQLNTAIIDRHCVAMEYYAASRRQVTRRTVAPYRIWYFNRTFYVIGHCRLRDDIRIFALNRIRQLESTGEPFAESSEIDIEGLMRSSFGVFVGERETVRIWFAADAADYVKESVWHASQRLRSRPDGSLLLEMDVAVSDEIKQWILRWGARARVLAPERLRRAIRAEAEAVAAYYGAQRPPSRPGTGAAGRAPRC
jgi:predicted DNA-binding transcriptional regulator YafY